MRIITNINVTSITNISNINKSSRQFLGRFRQFLPVPGSSRRVLFIFASLFEWPD